MSKDRVEESLKYFTAKSDVRSVWFIGAMYRQDKDGSVWRTDGENGWTMTRPAGSEVIMIDK